MNRDPAMPLSTPPFCKCTHRLIYFCFILSLFQFAMARGAHPHPRCVFLGRPEQNFPLHQALISVLCSGNSQLARLEQLALHGGLWWHWGQTKGVHFPEPHVSHIKHRSERDPHAMTRGPTLSLYKSTGSKLPGKPGSCETKIPLSGCDPEV